MTLPNVVPIGLKVRMDERMRLALDAMPVAVSWVNLADGRVEFTNRRYVELFGYGANDFPDVFGMIDATFANPAQADFAKGALRQVIGQSPLQQFEFPPDEVHIVARDGTRRITSFSGVVLPDASMSLATFVDITELKRQEELLHRMATEDALTGLWNRRSFDDAFDQSLTAGRAFAVVVLDLDGFKAVNDALGHDAGDELLRLFARLLEKIVRSGDRVCRWGGDEFAILLPSPLIKDDVSAVIARLKGELRRPIQLSGTSLALGASAGSALFPDDGRTSLELWRVADARMFEDKRGPGHAGIRRSSSLPDARP